MKKIAPLCVILAACFWGIMGIFVRGLDSYGLASMEIVAIRVFGAFVFLGLGILIYNPKLFIIKRKDIWCFAGMGIVSIVFFNFCYFSTIKMTSLSVAATLLYIAPAIVTVLGIFLFHEKFHYIKILALVMALMGCVLVTGILNETDKLSTAGLLFGIGSGVGYAMYSIFGHYALEKGYDSLTTTFYTFLFGMLGVLPFVKVKHIAGCLIGNISCIPLLMGLIFINTLAAYIFYTIGLGHMEAGKASILASIEPVVASLVGFFLYKEGMSIMTILGIALVCGSAVIVNLSYEKKAVKST